jgi:2-polyprenyl-3-methyl-5-hydroxy-6-metoxy-1,4-benzoquinol methylase
MNDEIEHLEKIANDSLYCAGVNRDTIEYSFEIFKRHIRGESILEIGPAEGVMTRFLAELGLKMTVVEGSTKFCEDLRAWNPEIEVIHSLAEDYHPEIKFDNIVLGHVLEHVDNPVQILEVVRGWLSDGGRVLAAVPNSRSLHRQAAVIMEMLDFEEQLNEADHHHGHRRVYNPETFRHDFIAAGLEIQIFGGYWMKPVSNSQIEQTWTPQMLNAFMKLGERYPDIAGEIYIVAGNAQGD